MNLNALIHSTPNQANSIPSQICLHTSWKAILPTSCMYTSWRHLDSVLFHTPPFISSLLLQNKSDSQTLTESIEYLFGFDHLKKKQLLKMWRKPKKGNQIIVTTLTRPSGVEFVILRISSTAYHWLFEYKATTRVRKKRKWIQRKWHFHSKYFEFEWDSTYLSGFTWIWNAYKSKLKFPPKFKALI